jgi:hypothetical protein
MPKHRGEPLTEFALSWIGAGIGHNFIERKNMTPEYEKNIMFNGRIQKFPGRYVSKRNVSFWFSNAAEQFVALHEATTSRLTSIPFKYFKCMFREDGKVIIGEGQFATVCPETPLMMESLMMYLQDAIPRLQKLQPEIKNEKNKTVTE